MSNNVGINLKKSNLGLLLITAIMVTALLSGPVSILRMFAPEHPWNVLLLVIFLVAVEAFFTTKFLGSKAGKTNPSAYRAAEIVLIFVILRIVTWLLFNNFPSHSDLLSYLENPFNFFDSFFVAFIFLSIFAWNRSLTFFGVFTRLKRNREEARQLMLSYSATEDPAYHYYAPEDSATILGEFYRSWIFSGLILVVAASLTTVRTETAGIGISSYLNLRNISRLDMHPSIMLALVIYFLTGFWLASQARQIAVQTRWYMSRTDPEPRITQRWGLVTIMILLGIALVAAFLPIGSTLAISRLIQIVIGGLSALAALLISIITFIFVSVIGRIFGTNTGEVPQFDFTYEEIVPAAPTTGQISELPLIVFGGLFWITVIAVTVGALYIYFSNRRISLNGTGIYRLVQEFMFWLRSWFTSAAKRIQVINREIRSRIRAPQLEPNKASSRFNFIRVSKLPAHEQLRFFYLSTIKRARDQGISRGLDETPLEFTKELKSSWPDSSGEIDGLTQAFIKARYSNQNIATGDVSTAKSIWKQLRAAIRKSR